MAVGKKKINIVIDGNVFELYIDIKDEELYRRAGKEVDERIASLKSKWKVQNNNNYMTMVAFQLAFEKAEREIAERDSPAKEQLNDILNKLKDL